MDHPAKALKSERRVFEKEVTYALFQREYWTRGGLSGAAVGLFFSEYTVYREILVIKAGRTRDDRADNPRFEPLSREEYVGGMVSLESATVLGVGDREKIYHLYEIYQGRLRKRGEWDVADATNQIFRRWLRRCRAAGGGKGYEGRQVTALCVDETQDLLMRQVALFRCVVDSLRGGGSGGLDALCLAADTAQAIEHGRAFSFSGLKDEVLSSGGADVLASLDNSQKKVHWGGNRHISEGQS